MDFSSCVCSPRLSRALFNLALTSAVAFALTSAPAGAQQAPVYERGNDQRTTLTGIVNVMVADDFEQHRSRVLYYLKDQRSGKMLRLALPRAPRSVGRSGRSVTLSGALSGDTLSVDEESLRTLEATTTDPSGTGSAGTGGSAPAAQTTRRALVMVASFQDVSAECPVEAVNTTLFAPTGSVDALYRETSLGKLGFSGTVVGPYAVADTVTGKCDPFAWSSALESQARAAGIDPSQYENLVYVLPSASSCAVGSATVGGSPGVSYIERCGMSDAFAHELGHNLALNHASTPTDTYGDTSDIMGYSGRTLRGMNAAHHHQLGWRAASQIQTVTADGYYDIAPLELDATQATAPQMLRVAKPDTGETYYLSWRQPIGFDSNLTATQYNLSVHRYAGTGGMTYLLGNYADGQSFADPANGLTFTAVSRSTGTLTVQVQFNTSCMRTAPTITLTPASQSATAGTAVPYALSVTNRDSAACGASSFVPALTALPTGWSATTVTSVSIAPGASAQVTLNLSSASGAAPGGYNFQAQVSDAALATHAASVPGTYTVLAPCTRSAPTITMTPSAQTGAGGQTLSYGLTLSNRDSASCTASTFALSRTLPSGWSGAISTSSMLLSPGQSASSSLTATPPATAAVGSYALTVSAADGAYAGHQASVSGTHSVTATADTQAPTAPTGLTASVNLAKKQITLKWTAASDNVAVTGYRILRDGLPIAQTASTGYVDLGVTDTATHQYAVNALDAAGNVSMQSTTVNASLAKRR